MRASNELIERIIKPSEGFRAEVYLCPAGIPTIGYGSTHYPDGTTVRLSDPPLTEDEAGKILLSNLQEYESAVNRYVNVPVTQGQFDALVDFAYNCGVGSLRSSTLLKKLNKKDYRGAANQFERWIYANGKPLDGLKRRRNLEKMLFLS